MLQGACYSRPVYGHSHYKKFWLKKMESEGEQSLSPPGSEYSRASSERSGVFWKNRAAVGGNCPPLELKRRTSSTRLSTVRSTEDKPKEPSKQKLTILGGNDLECTLALGLQMPHTDGFPPLKRGAFRLEMGEEERKPLEQLECSSLTERSRDKILPGGLNDSQIGRSRADGDRDLHKVVEEYKDPDDGSLSFGNAFGTEEIGKEIYLASVNPPGGRAERLVEDGKGCGAVTRTCSHCKTANTPLWRNGPNGPKSLCNACGIRYKKIGRRCGGNGEQQRSAARSLVRQMAKRKREADLSQSHPRKKSNTLAALRTVAVAPNNGESATCFARDEEEGAALLMGLSCGLANALA